MTDPEVGARTARRRRGLSQAAVAEMVGRSESWLSASQLDRARRMGAVARIRSDEATDLLDASC